MEGGERRCREGAPEFLFVGAVVCGSGESKGKIKVPQLRALLPGGWEGASGRRGPSVKGGQAMFLLYSQAIAQVIRVKDSPGRLASVGAREKCHPCSSCAGQSDPVAIPKDSLCLR